MKIGAIDTSHIEAMMAQLKSVAAKVHGEGLDASGVSGLANATGINGTPKTSEAGNIGFSDVLKSSLDKVNTQLQSADQLGQRFSLGDDKVSLSDTMIAMQKASLSFQASIQVRNKLVSAYHDIMAMQV